RTKLARESGGYLESRKGADSEFRIRLEKYTGKQIKRVKKPLYLTRLSNNSLSRADFKPGWSHPARRSFWNACLHWHRTASRSSLRLIGNNTSPLPIPNRFRTAPYTEPRNFDVVFACDWRAYEEPQQSMLDEINEI